MTLIIPKIVVHKAAIANRLDMHLVGLMRDAHRAVRLHKIDNPGKHWEMQEKKLVIKDKRKEACI